jgi:hypothetical protein
MFAIALLNKPPKEVSDKWDAKLVELALSAKNLDPTRDFITLDGDRDMDGRLPVWSKHFGHGLRTKELPENLNKPLVVGEFSATYYGKPSQLYPFAGDKAFESYSGRSEALAVDVYQNAVQMARPYLAYFSPSEVSWFGIEHLNLGYSDFSRLPRLQDGIFAGKPYEEGKPGYQYERIPPYVTTFNPGLDPALPLYKPLPMFEALKAALSAEKPLPCPWDTFIEKMPAEKLSFPDTRYASAAFLGNLSGELYQFLRKTGVQIQAPTAQSNLLIIEADYITAIDSKIIKEIKKNGGMIWLMLSDKEISPAIHEILPDKLQLTDRYATALEPNKSTIWGKYFDLPDLYFAEIENDPKIIKRGLSGNIVNEGTVVFTASRTDWSLFNQNPENKKCAQIVLYEHLQKSSGAALVTCPFGNATLVLSTLDYRIQNETTDKFWKSLLAAMQIRVISPTLKKDDNSRKNHDLLLDGPVDSDKSQGVNPLGLNFHRLAVRRFIFSNNLTLGELVPSEIVTFKTMHPAFAVSTNNEPVSNEAFRPKIEKGQFVLDAECGKEATSIFVGGVNPYATYELNIESMISSNGEPVEAGMEWARLGLRDRIQVVARSSPTRSGISVRIYKDNQLLKEMPLTESLPQGEFSLKVQLYGRSLGVFITQNGESKYIGHLPVKEHFGEALDFRNPDISGNCTFNIISNLKGRVAVRSARSYLSPGIGQADVRLISYEDLSPYFENGRLWFTFSCRGLDTPQSVQGVLSLDPSVFDVRFEGMIVFDHGDGLLRNDYASHLFYDRENKEWRAFACDFGGSFEKEGRAATGLITAASQHDPRRGFSVMKAKRVEPEMLEGKNEDPCIFFDSDAGKWRLLTSAFVSGNITARMYESDSWDGKYKIVTQPIDSNSTGTSIQKIGGKYYALMGGNGNLRVHSYPGLAAIGELSLDLQPHWPKPAGRVWASVVPLPEGYPYRYVLLTMDRPNFPDVKGPNWSYGALYFYGAN